MRKYEPRLIFACERVHQTDDVLDLGTHKGEMAIALWSKTVGRVVGVDISHNALDHAKKLADLARFDIVYVNAWAEHLPFPDQSFDVVVCCEILEHVVDVDRVVAEAERVTRNGGRIVVSVPADALENDKRDAEHRDTATGYALDMHVREFDPATYFADRPGLTVARGEVRYEGADENIARFEMCSYEVRR